jgi:hypothetical protein
MIGTNRMTLNQETLSMMVQAYLNAHTFKDEVRVKSVTEETVTGYGNSSRKEWIAVIEPAPKVPPGQDILLEAKPEGATSSSDQGNPGVERSVQL